LFDCGSLFLDLAVLLEELIQHHRVHRFIADGVRLAFFVPRYQIGVRNFFCHFVRPLRGYDLTKTPRS
jgi:hypothetical protein